MNKVQDNRSEQEFSLDTDAGRAVAAYQREGNVIVFTHTNVPRAAEGRGTGSRLIRGALDSARDQGLRVVAQCSFVAAFIDKHPTYRDLLGR